MGQTMATVGAPKRAGDHVPKVRPRDAGPGRPGRAPRLATGRGRRTTRLPTPSDVDRTPPRHRQHLTIRSPSAIGRSRRVDTLENRLAWSSAHAAAGGP